MSKHSIQEEFEREREEEIKLWEPLRPFDDPDFDEAERRRQEELWEPLHFRHYVNDDYE